MNELFRYLKLNVLKIAMFFAILFVFVVVSIAYNADLQPIIYACIICCVLGIIVFSLDYVGYQKKIAYLENIEKEVLITLKGLPTITNNYEKEYQNLLKNLFEHMQSEISNRDSKYRNINDYYILWAHQIKTPIQAMRLLLDVDEEVNKNDIKEQLFRIEEYVDMALQYIRVEDASDLVVAQYQLDDVIKDSIKRYSSLFIKNKLAIKYEPINRLITTDKKWFGFVIDQLLSNALKYTNEGYISIYLVNDDLIIEDTGIGISDEDLPRVFEKGYTGYNGRNQSKSTGIGLYLVKSVVNKLGYSISIASKKGEGTKVIIDIHEHAYDQRD